MERSSVVDREVRVLHVISSVSPADGGPPEAVRQLAIAYKRAGISAEVLSLDKPDESFLKNWPCPVHALGPPYLGKYGFSPRLRRWLGAHAGGFDFVVINGIWSFPNTAVRWAARHARKPYGVFVHGALDPWFNKQYPLKHLKKILYWPFQYAVLRDAKAVFFTSETESRLARQSFRPNGWKEVVVPYGIGDPEVTETKPADAQAQVQQFHAAVPALRGKPYLLFLGRIHEKKGCDLLIQAFASHAGCDPDLHLVVVGPDQVGMQPSLQKQSVDLGVADRVHWPGPLRGDLKWGALRACDAFILPSHQENFGIAVVEALAVGRPVLISDKVNIWQDIVADGVGLVKNDTLEGTKQLLQGWLALSDGERKTMADRARDCFLRRYSVERTVQAIVSALLPAGAASSTARESVLRT